MPVPMQTTWCTDMSIDGEQVTGESSLIVVHDPATELELARVRGASEVQIDRAARAARQALRSPAWRDPDHRSHVLGLMADVIEQHAELLTASVVHEVGTPISLARPLQVQEPINLLRSFARLTRVGAPKHLGPADGPIRSDATVNYRPSGVVAAITAYNYPLLFAAVKVGAAFAAGCTVVLMPSPQTPLSTLLLARLWQEAGVPRGVLNVIVGDSAAGRALTTHPEVNKISFTGSIEVGRTVMGQAAHGLKRVVLELGGKSPSLVLPGVDIGPLTEQLHARYIRNAGQGCSSPTRLLIHESQVGVFLERSREVLAAMKVGDPWDPAVVAGPLISSQHRSRVEGYVVRAVGAGGRVAAGGGRPDIDRGWYMNPVLVDGVDNRSEIAQEELFGPVGVVLPYRTVDEAVAIANDSRYGLAATVYGDPDEARAVAPRLEAGTVMINGWMLRTDAPSGGLKMSGMGREVGEEGVREFLETQLVAWPA